MPARYTFFSGKGGVGKTSMACATAVSLAAEGKRTLIVTTDPASNLGDVFEQSIGHQVVPIGAIPRLWAMDIDPDRAAEEYRERALGPIRALFPLQMVQVIEEQMSGPCTTEVAAFDRFIDFLTTGLPPETIAAGEPEDPLDHFDAVIFDTAPTGHTLRLLELPFEWSRSIDQASQGAGQTCIGPAAAIQDAKLKYERAMAVLRDPAQTKFVFVLHPEAIAIRETQRAVHELSRLGIHAHELIVNGIVPPEESVSLLFAARREMQDRYLAQIATTFPLPTRQVLLQSGEIRGAARLRALACKLYDREPGTEEAQAVARGTSSSTLAAGASIVPAEVLPHILPNGQARTLFFAGKGGVGKTVASCLTAVWLARQGFRTLLLTTDPAAHLGDVLGVPIGDDAAPVAGMTNLWAAKIDPKAAADTYRARILDDARERGRSEQAIEVMAEELDSPCTEEMAAFDRFIDFAGQPQWQVVVFDTAPTGHTLRLLQLPVDWSQQLNVKVFASVDSAAADDVAKQRFAQVIAMMRDPKRSTFAFVMYPEATPVLEAYRAAQELRAIGIAPGLVVANMVLPPEQCNTPFSQARRAMQQQYLAEMAARFTVPVLQIPLLPQEIRGLDLLQKLGDEVFGSNCESGGSLVNHPTGTISRHKRWE